MGLWRSGARPKGTNFIQRYAHIMLHSLRYYDIVSGTLTQASLNCERNAHACPPKFASVVQSVEQALRKRQAVGSIPAAGSGKFWRVK